MEVYLIGPATERNIIGIQEVRYQGWRHAYLDDKHGFTAEKLQACFKDRHSPRAVTNILEKMRNPREGVYQAVACLYRRVIGFIEVQRRPSENELSILYVLPAYHRLGVASALWNFVQPSIDPGNHTIADVVSYNTGAIAFYKHLGFVKTGIKESSDFPLIQMTLPGRPASL